MRYLTAIAMACLTLTAAAGQTAPAPGSLTDVTGVWTMLVAGHQIGLELTQDGTKVKA